MRVLLPTKLIIVALGVLMPIAANAFCEEYTLSAAQSAYLDEMAFEIEVPEGEFADYTTMRCDVNDDGMVDISDIRAISGQRNTSATGPDDPMDWNQDGSISVSDARGCQRACTFSRCSVGTIAPPPTVVVTGSDNEEACSQNEDFDGDGVEDFAGLYENTSEETTASSGDWKLDLVLLYTDSGGATRHVTFPSAGRYSASESEIYDTLKVQPAGVVNLFPGSATLDRPGIVSYRNGRPAVLYFWHDSRYTQRVFYVDD